MCKITFGSILPQLILNLSPAGPAGPAGPDPSASACPIWLSAQAGVDGVSVSLWEMTICGFYTCYQCFRGASLASPTLAHPVLLPVLPVLRLQFCIP